MKRALVIGSAGQDGWYLSEQLLAAGVEVIGLTRSGAAALGAGPAIATKDASLQDAGRLTALVAETRPDALFYLAATFGSSEQRPRLDEGELERASFAVHVDGWQAALEALVRHAPACRAFYAGSSLVFGAPPTLVQDESTPFSPQTHYARSKAAGIEVAREYRRRGYHVSAGILYNHESPRRPSDFITQRVARGAAHAAATGEGEVELGDLSAVVDWMFAGDATAAMRCIVEHPEPGDYIVASGVPHTIAQLCEFAYSTVGLDWRGFVRERPGRLTRPSVSRIGDPTRLRTLTGWSPKVSFEVLVRMMVEGARAGA